ncbi:MAG TPA: M56 family metallopeptidase [Longimicrobiales bacterium]|nr:M56 family metallopeptidase [Longimicrobiales bacterium]
MTAAWMLYSAVVSGLIGMAALAGQHACRMLRRPVRWVWIAGMTAAVLLSVVGLMRVRMPDGPEPVQQLVTALDVEASRTGEMTSSVTAPLLTALEAVRRGGAGAAQRMYDAVAGAGGRSLPFLWASSTLALFAAFSLTLLRLRRARRHWRSHRVGDVQVLVSVDAGPALIGLIHPAIVIPRWLLGQSPERQRLVVQHEDEHRRAGDHLTLALGCTLVCMMPWNIALWWMLRRMRLAVELDCDARVLGRGVSARPYGEVLLEIAGRMSARPFGAPALADTRTHLERRLIAMTGKNRAPHHRHGAVAALAALALLGTACAADLPTAAAIDEMDATTAQVQAERAGLLVPLTTEERPLFIVDGIIATSEAARKIAPGEIHSIEVIKAPAAVTAWGERARHGVVEIRTHAASDATALRHADRTAAGEVTEMNIIGKREPVVVRGSIIRFEPDEGADRPLIVIDGVIADLSFSLNSLAPESIERIEVLKGEAARHMYEDARATNGVIRITTKAGGR